MSSLDIFLKWFFEYYSHEFKDIPKEEKEEIIREVLLNNGKYITKYEVMDFDGCVQCGRCCRDTHCQFLRDDNLCDRHDNPIHKLCETYPWTGELGIAPLTINCQYQVSFFIDYFDRTFSNIEKVM